jgi:hypothetical protein
MASTAAKWLILEQENRCSSSKVRKTPEGLHIPAVTMANRLLKLFETLIHVQDEMKYNQKR